MTGSEFLVPATNDRFRRNSRSAFDVPPIFMRFQWKSALCLLGPLGITAPKCHDSGWPGAPSQIKPEVDLCLRKRVKSRFPYTQISRHLSSLSSMSAKAVVRPWSPSNHPTRVVQTHKASDAPILLRVGFWSDKADSYWKNTDVAAGTGEVNI